MDRRILLLLAGLRALCTVLRASLHTSLNALRIERAAEAHGNEEILRLVERPELFARGVFLLAGDAMEFRAFLAEKTGKPIQMIK